MAYPLIPDSWTDPITQNLYAAVLFLLAQGIVLGVWRILKWFWRTKPTPRLVAALGWIGLFLPPLLMLALILTQPSKAGQIVMLTALSMAPAAVAAIRTYTALRRKANEIEGQLDRFVAVGVHDAIVNPTIDNYRRFLSAATSGFAFQGVGAEKLTRDFDVFQSMVSI